MTLAELLEPRGVEAQLYPLLSHIEMKPGEYTKRRQEATDKLFHAGHLVIATETDSFKGAMVQIVEILNYKTHDSILLIPHDSPALFQGESRISKIPTQKVRRYEDLPASEKGKTLGMLTEEMIRSVRINGRLIGYDFMNSKGERNIVQLVDVIRAYEMMEDSYDAANVRDMSIDKTPGKRYSKGMNADILNVPSTDPARPGETYNIPFRHVAMADRQHTERFGIDEANAALTFNIWSKHDCEKDHKINAGYGRQTKTTDTLLTSDENLLDHHVIFAYLAYQRFISENKPDKMVPDLFPKSTEAFRDNYFWPLYNHTLKEEMDAAGNITRVPLAIGEIEGILWSVIGYMNETKLGRRK
jgi:hypothetical protein